MAKRQEPTLVTIASQLLSKQAGKNLDEHDRFIAVSETEDNATNFIKSRLAPGEHIQASVLLEQAGAQGISQNQLEAARIKLGIDKQKIGTGTRWIWVAAKEAAATERKA